MAQLEIEFTDNSEPNYPILRSLRPGQLFRMPKSKDVYMKLKPVNFLCNSTIISDVFARGDCIVSKFGKGTVNVMSGNTAVIKLSGTLRVTQDVEAE